MSRIDLLCADLALTMVHDNRDLPFLYIANKSEGMTIYDISDLSAPQYMGGILTEDLNFLHVMNLVQRGDFLYLALGNHFSDSQQGGAAIVNISDPQHPMLMDIFMVPNAESGGGIIKVEGDIAYLGAMKEGLVLLDISDPTDISLISQYIPDINYPVNNPNPDLYNARGMAVRSQIVFLCYDAGGLRIIDCTQPGQPEEIGQYANPELHIPINLPRAYNNITLDDNLAYVAVDYCGIEVLDISDYQNITMTGWWNPLGCPDNNWFTSPVHTNELVIDRTNDLLYTSAGSSDMIVLDISDPTMPDSCNAIGGEGDKTGTWGVDAFKDKIFLSYICAVIPFLSVEAYVSIIECVNCNTVSVKEEQQYDIVIYPNPTTDYFTLNKTVEQVDIYNLEGNVLNSFRGIKERGTRYEISNLLPGLYLVHIASKDAYQTIKLLKY